MAAALASAVGARSGAIAGAVVAMLAAWILFKTQLDIIESMVRSITDIVWTGSHRARALSRGDVRVVYYGALGARVPLGHLRAAAGAAHHAADARRATSRAWSLPSRRSICCI